MLLEGGRERPERAVAVAAGRVDQPAAAQRRRARRRPVEPNRVSFVAADHRSRAVKLSQADERLRVVGDEAQAAWIARACRGQLTLELCQLRLDARVSAE